MPLKTNLICKPSLLDNKGPLQNVQEYLVNMWEKKQVINLIEQMSLCYITDKNAEWIFQDIMKTSK